MRKNQNTNNNNNRNLEPPLELVNQFLENQRQELKNATQEIELQKLNNQNTYDYSCKALEAQKEDRG